MGFRDADSHKINQRNRAAWHNPRRRFLSHNKIKEKFMIIVLAIVDALSQFGRAVKEIFKNFFQTVDAICDLFSNICDGFKTHRMLKITVASIFIAPLYIALYFVSFAYYLIKCVPPLFTLIFSIALEVERYMNTQNGGAILTPTKRYAYLTYRENLLHVYREYQEDLRIRAPQYSYRLTPSNPYVLRGNVWMCCYRVSKRDKTAFDSNHIEFVAETVDGEISAMLANGFYDGVTYPCNYNFVVDEVVDNGGEVLIYVLFVEDSNDAAYVARINAVNHDSSDAPAVMEDDDFGG
jgi:hypothetical protein